MKLAEKLDRLSLVLILVVIAAAAYYYPQLPAEVATHWNLAGQADDWSSKNFQTFFVPTLMIAMYALFHFLPKMDPKIKNQAEFAKVYKVIQASMMGFFAALFFVTTLVNLGYDISVGRAVPLMVGILFMIIGFYIKDVKPNWFLGIRTPWTLSSDIVWQKTHAYGSKMFIIGGLIFASMSFLPEETFIPLFVLMFVMIMSSVVYSYISYREHK